MKTDSATQREQTAWLLVQAGYNASELAEALEVQRETGVHWIRRFGATTRTTELPSPGSRRRDGWSWTDRLSLTQCWQQARGFGE